MPDYYTLRTEKTEEGFQHTLKYNGEPLRGSTTSVGINRNSHTGFLTQYAITNEEIITSQCCRSIEIIFELDFTKPF